MLRESDEIQDKQTKTTIQGHSNIYLVNQIGQLWRINTAAAILNS